jgi:hypothetical protein
MNHGAHFMAAIAYVWNERKHTKAPVRNKVSKCVLASPVQKTFLFLLKDFTLGYFNIHLTLFI